MNKSNKVPMTYHNVINNYQTTIRNVGLYTSISLAFLGYSRYYRGKNKLYNVGPLIISMFFNFFSILFLLFLLEDHKVYNENIKDDPYYNLLDKWYIIPQTLLFIISIVLLFSIYTLYKQIKH